MHERRFKRVGLLAFLIASAVLLPVIVFLLWQATYPDRSDPKNFYYVFWKYRLNKNMNLDNALGAMTGDVNRDRLVLGLSEAQLADRFGYVKELNEVGLYYQECQAEYWSYRGGATGENKAIFLRDSPWMVILKNGVAANLVLCKGY